MEFGQILLWSIAIICFILVGGVILIVLYYTYIGDGIGSVSPDKLKEIHGNATETKDEQLLKPTQPTPIYNTPVNAQTIKENIDSICRWEQQGDKYHYVVISDKLHGKYLIISRNSLHYNNKEFIAAGDVISDIRIQPISERFKYADFQVTSPVEGALSFNKQSEYNTRDIIMTIDTDNTMVEKHREAERLKSIKEQERIEQLMTSEVLQWQLREDGAYLMATEALSAKFPDCQLSVDNFDFYKRRVYAPNEVACTLSVINREYDVVYTFPVTQDREYVIVEKYILGSSKHVSHAPFLIYIISTDASAISEFKQRAEDSKMRAMAEKAEREQQERDEVAAKIKERHRLRQLEKAVELELIEKGEIFKESKRPPIPSDVRDAVYNRDGGKCVECGSRENLHFDHIIPYSKGGATNIENLQILCQKCNLQKSNKIG